MNNKPHADVLWQLLLYQSTAKVPRKYSFPLNRLLSASVYIFDSLHYKLRLEVSAVRYCWISFIQSIMIMQCSFKL